MSDEMRGVVMLALWVLACAPSSGTDRERSREERIAAEGDGVWSGERDRRRAALIKQAFTERLRGQVTPDAGCDVCPDMCRDADLRPVPGTTWQRLYRRAAMDHGYPRDDPSYQLAALELERLGCIARGDRAALKQDWLALLHPGEDPAVRFFAAVQLAEHGIDEQASRRALIALAAGLTRFRGQAELCLEEWQLGIVPSL